MSDISKAYRFRSVRRKTLSAVRSAALEFLVLILLLNLADALNIIIIRC